MVSAIKVLVADDNRDAAESLGILLSISGYRVLVAHSGFEALELALREHPDVLILDIGMPVLSGYEVARGIRQQDWGKHALLLAISGWDQQRDRDASSAAGFDVHLSKPARPESVEELLAEFSTRRQARRELAPQSEGRPLPSA
ncbi:MAG TPA: response regulator [Steroidobacteraceae bacterium]